jgi:hypothetical protein
MAGADECMHLCMPLPFDNNLEHVSESEHRKLTIQKMLSGHRRFFSVDV